jgi:hypothetical protein
VQLITRPVLKKAKNVPRGILIGFRFENLEKDLPIAISNIF